jgi:hypothetical protein
MSRRTAPIRLLVAALVVVAVGEVVRRRYFYGKFLDVDDLTQEQQYHRCRRHLH